MDDLRQVEEALRDSEEKYRVLVENTSNLICVFQDNHFIYMNSTMAMRSGWTAEEMISPSFDWIQKLIPEEYRKTVRRNLKGRLKGEDIPPYEIKVNTRFGYRIPVIVHGQVITYRGKPAIAFSLIDISEQKRAEELLIKSEDEARQIASENQLIAEIGRIISSTLNIEDVYDRFAEKTRNLIPCDRISISLLDEKSNTMYAAFMSGLEVSERTKGKGLPLSAFSLFQQLVIKGSGMILPMEDVRELEAHYPGFLIPYHAGLRTAMLIPLISQNRPLGVLYFWSFQLMAFSERHFRLAENIAAQISGAIANGLLYKEITMTQKALRESEEKYRDLFEKSSDLLYYHDLEGKLITTNLAFKSEYGWSGKDILHSHLRDFVAPGHMQEFEDSLKRVKEKERDEGLMWLTTKEGSEVVIEYKNSLVYSVGGIPIGVRGSGRDITDRMIMEEEKKKLHAQLAHAQRMEAIGTLAGGIAHNFNNLLMGIQGNASLGLMEIKDTGHPVYARLNKIESLVQDGAKMTNQLLGYARAGRYEIKPVDLNRIVQGAANAFAGARKDITIHQDLAEGLFFTAADQGQMEQVLLNLLVNAGEAMSHGGQIFIKTRNVSQKEMEGKPYHPKPGNYVLLDVTDTGIGMDEKTIARIFEPFFTTKDPGRGTGLGLASVYGIIKGHGGSINVHSKKNEGSRFEIYLPASQRFTINEEKTPEPISERIKTILLVDDEEMILEVGKEILERMGYQAIPVKSGIEALQKYTERQQEIDLVILDMIMPEMNGGEAFDRMKALNPHIKVLLSSGYSIDGQAQEILNRGCMGFIQKPFSMKDLSLRLRGILKDKV